MKIHEDRSHMNIDTRWFEKGYAKEDVHSLRLQSLCTEAEAAANKQFYDSHTREEWEQYIRQASLESSAAMKPVMEAIAQDFVCYQYDENIPVSYGSDRWDLYFWCNPFNGAADASERDFSYFTLTFNGASDVLDSPYNSVIICRSFSFSWDKAFCNSIRYSFSITSPATSHPLSINISSPDSPSSVVVCVL